MRGILYIEWLLPVGQKATRERWYIEGECGSNINFTVCNCILLYYE